MRYKCLIIIGVLVLSLTAGFFLNMVPAAEPECTEGEIGSFGYKCSGGVWELDFWEHQKYEVRQAKLEKEQYQAAYAEMEAFCGIDNVWEGSGWGAERVFGCDDYSIVELEDE